MKKKQEIDYNSKQDLIQMIVRLWDNVPTNVARQNLMAFLISNYRGMNLGSMQTLLDMPYDELERMYVAMKFVLNEGK
jgi:hypothetical protein